ncbi:uncharacterized protein LOC126815194 [Patella vulgata]|uniref:uncharacterized protein LOC126815194 n=1 Tax=Patella vulgata TaxID=6465 RepID=UPI00217FDF68|nr:uncharacterized protein LOC126815194 [Patella vulgata]
MMGPAPRTASFQHQPYDNLLAAIVTTLFCFFPFGCCSLYYSFKTRRCYKQGQLRRSIMAARHSQTMAQMSCIVGLMLWFGGAITLLLYTEDLL